MRRRLIEALYDKHISPNTLLWHTLPEFSIWPELELPTIDGVCTILTTKLHYENCSIWHYEDYARTDDIIMVAWAKKHIDTHNQKRNDLIEQLDDFFVRLQPPDPTKFALLSSDTLGSIVDRLSVIDLKIFHTCELLADGTKSSLKQRLDTLTEQRDFLLSCGVELYDGIIDGTRRIKIFKQLKMYNDAETNPKISKKVRITPLV